MTDQWAWYLAALEGRRGDFDPRNPPSGYYRSRDRSLAVWRDDAGTLQWLLSSGMSPRHHDQFCDTFAFFAPNPVTYEVWEKHRGSGLWPENPEQEIAAARAARLPSNDAPEHEAILDELASIRAAYDAWLDSIGGAIATQEHDDKLEAYVERVAELKKRATEAHKVDKQPWLDGGRAVDDRWCDAKDKADAEKRAMAAPALAFRLARQERRDEEARQARKVAEQARREAMAASAPIPMFEPIRKKASGLRTSKDAVVTDLPALAAYLAAFPKGSAERDEFEEACRKIAKVLLKRDEAVPGAQLQTSMVAA